MGNAAFASSGLRAFFGLVGVAVFLAARLGVDVGIYIGFTFGCCCCCCLLLLLLFVVVTMGAVPKPDESTATARCCDPRGGRFPERCGRRSSYCRRWVGHFVRSVDTVQWLGQMESQFGLVRIENELAASIPVIHDSVSTCAAQCAHLGIVLQTLLETAETRGSGK